MPSTGTAVERTDVEPVEDPEADPALRADEKDVNPADIGVFWYNDPSQPGGGGVEVLDPVEQNRILVAAIHGEPAELDRPADDTEA